ncbi:MAG: citrate synthase [Thermodesulfobacteriota bacterium]|nr:citrate synthase [Thermodesulfobacteriota bacterium]
MGKTARLIIDGETCELPIIEGSEGERALDISFLRKQTGLITLDPGYANTGSCESSITFMDGEKGILRYRGVPVEQLAEKATFKETAYLLIHGKLPNSEELKRYSMLLNDNSLVHEDMKAFYMKFPRNSHPMGILSAMVNALRSFYPELNHQTEEEEIMITMTRLMAKIRTMAAMSYKISKGHKVIYPRPDLTYCENFLNMMFDTPVMPYKINSLVVKALRVFWILHADHEQNCSTSSVRMVGSARVNLYAAISSGIAALWGPLHGGANQAVIEMLTEIHDSGGNYKKAIERAKDRNDPFRLMGFGHRVYKTYDPRATIMKKMCDDLLESLHISDPLLDIAKELEIQARKDPYFIDHHLYPNVDFFSGIVLRAIGIPTNMFTVMFAIGRLPGWIAQWKESIYDPKWKISRPRQIYIGSKKRDFTPIAERD